MLVTVRKRAQLTIPKTIMEELNLKQGDMLDCTSSGGSIVFTPVKIVSIPKKNDILL